MSHSELVALLLVLTAIVSWVNFRPAFLPRAIGLLVMGLGASLVVIGAEAVMPGLFNHEGPAALLRQVDFQEGSRSIGPGQRSHFELLYAQALTEVTASVQLRNRLHDSLSVAILRPTHASAGFGRGRNG